MALIVANSPYAAANSTGAADPGTAAAAVEKCRQAEALLLESAEWVRTTPNMGEDLRRPRLSSCYDNLRKLYEVWDRVEPGAGKAELAARWRREWSAYTGNP